MRAEVNENNDLNSVFLISPEIVAYQEDMAQYIEMIGSNQFFME